MCIRDRTKELLILEEEMKAVAGNLYVTTDDGSYGRSGMVTKTIQDLVEQEGKHYDLCVAIGPMIMMKFVCKTTEALNIPTIVSLNPIMVDGTGMCGACRAVSYTHLDVYKRQGQSIDRYAAESL